MINSTLHTYIMVHSSPNYLWRTHLLKMQYIFMWFSPLWFRALGFYWDWRKSSRKVKHLGTRKEQPGNSLETAWH